MSTQGGAKLNPEPLTIPPFYRTLTKSRERTKLKPKYVELPHMNNGIVYFGSDNGNLYSVNAETGKEEWKFETQGAVRSSPYVTAGKVYAGSHDGNLYSVNAETGKEDWKYQIQGEVVSSPYVRDGVVYVVSSDGRAYAIKIIER